MAASASKVDLWTRALDRVGETKPVENEDDSRLAARVCRQHYDDILAEVLEAVPWSWARKQAPLSLLDEQAASTAYADAVSYTLFSIPFSYVDSANVVVDIDGSDLVEDTDYTITPANPQTEALALITLNVALGVGQTLTITVTTERVGWDHVYGLPSDCVTPLALLADGERYVQTPVDSRRPFAIMSNDAGTGRLLCTDQVVGDDFDVLEYVAAATYVPIMSRTFVEAVVCRLEEELWRALVKDLRKAADARQRCVLAISTERANMMNVGSDEPPPESPSLAARR